MDTIPSNVLAMIIRRCRNEDQFISLRLVDTRFYALSPLVRFRILVIDDILTFSPKLQRRLPAHWNGETEAANAVRRLCTKLLTYVVKLQTKSGNRLTAIRFSNQIPLTYRDVDWLSSTCPTVSTLDFSMNYDRDFILPLNPLTALPKFSSLRNLRLNYHIDSNFAPILAQLKLDRLEMGGLDAPINTADNSSLKQLTLISPVPLAYMDDAVYRLSDNFPNLKSHVMKDFFGGYSMMPSDFGSNEGYENYRRLLNLRQSDYVDTYFDRFLNNRLSIDFPNLRRLCLLKSSSFNPTSVQLSPAFDTFRNLTDLAFSVTPQNREFFKTVLTTNSTLTNLYIDIPFGCGSHLLETDLSLDNMPFRSRLDDLCIHGYDGLPLLAKFWYCCPKLAKLKFVDKSIIQNDHILDFEKVKGPSAMSPELEKIILNCDVSVLLLTIFAKECRLKNLYRLTMNVYRDAPGTKNALIRLFTKDRLPLLRRLDITFPFNMNASTDVTLSVLSSMPRLRNLIVFNLKYNASRYAKQIWQRMGIHNELERVNFKLCCAGDRSASLMDDLSELSILRRDRLNQRRYVFPWLKLRIHGTGWQEMIYTCPDARCWVEHAGRGHLCLDSLFEW